MRRKKAFLPHFRHACKMVSRNRKAYLKLSVTVVLSFTLLLAYMALTDATLYNRYAKVFSLPGEVVQCYSYEKATADILKKQVEENIPNAQYYSYFSANTRLTSFDASLGATCFFLPDGVETVYRVDGNSTFDSDNPYQTACAEPIRLIGEKQNFCLQRNEAIINETFYHSLLDGGAETPIKLPITFYWEGGGCSVWEVEVVGVCEDDSTQDIHYNSEYGITEGFVTIYLSQTQLESMDKFGTVRHIVFVSSESPTQVMDFGRALGMTVQGIAEKQSEAQTELRSSIRSKALTAAVMLALLAINLYSSFSNVLETRKFEIGVKRAIGAAKSSIVRQFLYEALLVLGFDTVFSGALVADGLIFYKLLQQYRYGFTWVIYVSPYSLAIYAFCTLSLTLTFSLIFAYRSTQVEVVEYLKAE